MPPASVVTIRADLRLLCAAFAICLGFCTDDTQMFGGGLHHPDVLVGKAIASRKTGKMFLIPRNGQIQRNTSPGQLRLRNSNQRFCSHKKTFLCVDICACVRLAPVTASDNTRNLTTEYSTPNNFKERHSSHFFQLKLLPSMGSGTRAQRCS